ncbi:MAG: DEAD/DEAH box helicase, partial [Spirochaetes bacterium]|nr:DEAD/DEAH box helicase [Spirochaetota bacterium]
GKTAGIVVSLIVGVKGGGAGVQALIIVPTAADVAKVVRVWTRFARLVRDAPLLLALGDTDDVRREQRRLEKGSAVVVGTVERVIDHIRRGSLLFDGLETVFVEAPEGGEREDFTRDAQFVFAKFPPRLQTVLFSRAPVGEQDELAALLHRPVLVTPEALAGEEGRGEAEHLVFEVAAGRKPEALARIILGRGISAALVLHSPRTDGEALARLLRRSLLRVEAAPSTIAPANRKKIFSAFARREMDALLLPFPSSGRLLPVELEELEPSHVIYFDLAPGARAPGAGREGAGRPGAAGRPGPGIIALASGEQARDIGRLQEAIGVTMKTGEVPGDEEVLGSSIRRIVGRIREEADPAELGRLRATIRRSVPFFMRSWFAAYLLKAHLPFEPAAGQPPAAPGKQGGGREPIGRQPLGRQQVRPRAAAGPSGPAGAEGLRESERLEEARRREPLGRQQVRPRAAAQASRSDAQAGAPRPARGERPRGETRREGPGRQQAAPPQPVIDRTGFTQLFVSIGRNRRIFARELTDLFVEKLHIDAGEIGDVRVFDKYSFVDIAAARAADAIAALSGTVLKGRPITVNYAKKKEEKEAK